MQNEVQEPVPRVERMIGKRIGDSVYVHISALSALSADAQVVIANGAQLAKLIPGEHFNVLKLHQHADELSLLDYPTFVDEPFPTLARSWRISLSRKTVIFRSYQESRNPPILHRKELLLLPTDERVTAYSSITNSAESLGLFDLPNRIGFREHWHALIAERGYELVGNEFVPLANAASTGTDTPQVAGDSVQRHRTALSRYNFSAPVQALTRHGLILAESTFFDYGCGRGDDVRGLVANGIDATGWDPHFAPNSDKRIADLVNIGFVINVIEDIDERIDALRGAYAHTRRVLAIAAMIQSQAIPEGRRFRDGYMTSRNTFQKYFTQAQLRDFIEHTLEEIAIAAGPGVFFVFRDKELEQQFLSRRYGHRAPTILSRGWIQDKPHREKAPRIDRETLLFDNHRALFERLWMKLLELGRLPDKNEIDNVSEVEAVAGSLAKACRITQSRFDAQEFELARRLRITDIQVWLAMQQFEKRKPYRRLESGLQRDVRAFFGDYASAWDLAKQALFEIGSAEAIDRACREAAEKGLGWLEDSQSLQLHINLLERLPRVLRIYVSCATVLCGDISTFDLVKIHIRSGKVSLLKFDDFENSPLPKLMQRVKVMLRDQDMDIFAYGAEYPSPFLYGKSRFINEEFPRYSEQIAFEEALDDLGIFDFSGYGPPAFEFHRELEQARWEVDGFNLRRTRRIPRLDERCGGFLTYRQLIECGETQAQTKISNLPLEADTYTALYDLATNILDPVIEYFGMIEVTYGFCSPELARMIPARIAPTLDQHAAHEKRRDKRFICDRLGAAVDFIVHHEDMHEVANWIATNTAFDRIYYYGSDRPIHVSNGPANTREFIEMTLTRTGRLVPRVRKNASPATKD